eukprot:gene27788-36615_t
MVNGSLQKRWFITERTGNKKDVYLYGSVEYSSIPLNLKQWKRLGQGGLYEPTLKMKELKITVQCEKLRGYAQDFDFTIGAEMLWVLLMSRSVSADQSYKNFVSLCTNTLVLNLLKDIQFSPSNSQILIAFAVCELNLRRGDFFSKGALFFPLPVWLLNNRNLEYLHYSPSLVAPLDPIQCIFGHFQVDNELRSRQHRAICIWLAINTRSSFELLVLDMNPIAALEMVKIVIIILNKMEMVSYEHLQSMQIILTVFLGKIGDVEKYGDLVHSTSLNSDKFDKTMPAIVVNESSIANLCSTLLSMRQGAGGQNSLDDPFHQILYASCFQLSFHLGKSLSPRKPNTTSISDNDLIDFSASQIISLMGLGLVEVAALNFYYPVATLCNRYVSANLDLYQPIEFEHVLVDLAKEVAIVINPAERNALLRSDNIRAALRLHHLVRFIVNHSYSKVLVVHYQGLLGQFVQLALQVSSPTLLDTTVVGTQSLHTWMKEAMILRLWAIELLDRFIFLCGFIESRQFCSISNPHYSVGARGLFLLAYQGIVGRLLAKVIAQLDSNMFNVWIICQSKSRSSVDYTLAEDDIYNYLQTSIDPQHWIYLSEDLAGAVAAIQDLSLDILIFGDLYMDSFVTHLAMFRMAPVQVCFWGHPHTSGFPSMDYFITSDDFEPNAVRNSRDHHFSEQLVRFDSLSFQMFPSEQSSGMGVFGKLVGGWCGCSKEVEPNFHADPWLLERERAIDWILMNGFDLYDTPVSAAVFIEPWTSKFCTLESVSNKSSSSQCADILHNIHLYGSLQSLMKMHPLFDSAIIGILRADPSAVILLLRNNRQLAWHRRLRNRLLVALQQSNERHLIDRVVFVNQRPHAEYMQLLCALDVSLDPFPFGGGVTLCDSFGGSCANARGSCGIPFITSGELQSVHRIGVGLAKAFNSSHTARNAGNLLHILEEPSGSADNNTTKLTKSLDSYVRAYVQEAVELSHHKRVCTSTDDRTESSEHFVIYQSLKAVKEWERFLVQIY